jgi:hypothetical protein
MIKMIIKGRSMYKSVIFIDFENLQKINIDKIDPKTKIIVIVGLDQDIKVLEFVKSLFIDVSSMELIKVNGRGPNALDLFIAFYIGKYFDSIKESEIIICSNDTGYDQLVKHLNGYGVSVKRAGLAEKVTKINIAGKKPEQKKETKKQKVELKADDVNIIIEYLYNQTKSQKNKRPKKLETLENYLHAHFTQKIKKENIKVAIEVLLDKKYINIINNKIDYNI